MQRPTSNLVKVASHPRTKSQANANMHALHAPITEWIRAECPVDFLNVWFPAHWAPIVLHELQQREDKYRQDHSLWFDAPSCESDPNKLVRERADALQSRVLHYHMGHMGKMDRDGEIATLTGKPKVDWIDFPPGGYPGAVYHPEGRDPSWCISSESSGRLVWVSSRESPSHGAVTWSA